MSDFSSERRVKKTSKRHKCQWCWGRIAAGEAAVYHSGVYDSDFSANYLHPECDRAVRKYYDGEREWYYPDERMPRGGIETENDCAEPIIKATENPMNSRSILLLEKASRVLRDSLADGREGKTLAELEALPFELLALLDVGQLAWRYIEAALTPEPPPQ